MGKTMQRLCSKCHSVQLCEDVPVQIRYGFNDKEHVLIEGVERVCKVCGWHVDDMEVSAINRDIALKAIKSGISATVDDRNEEIIAKESEERQEKELL